ncbi:cytochrome c [Pontibacterium sp.]|jgi:cytochrome c556|uniref:c-type cytochrome n=1 Tax=Pontibacterium sp. TaxID=2036026 RepID=UPI0035612E75
MLRKAMLSVVVSTVIVVSTPLVFAHGGAKGVVKERMDLMDNMKGAMKTLSAIYKGEQEYDADTVRKAALIIRDNSGNAMTTLFPKGSAHSPSEAKPNIWQEWERFEKLAKRQQVISQGLHDSADNRSVSEAKSSGHMMGGGSGSMMGKSMMGGGHMMGGKMDTPEHYAEMPSEMVFKMLTDNCSSCHTRYRAED